MYTLYDTSHHKHHTITCKNVAFRIRKYQGKTHCTHPSTLQCSLSFWEQGNIYPLQTQLYPRFSFTHSNFTSEKLRKDSFSNINRDYNRICIKTGSALCRELALWSIPALTFETVWWDKENNLPVPCIVKQRIQINSYIISFPFWYG